MIIESLKGNILCNIVFCRLALMISVCHDSLAFFIDYIGRYLSSISLNDVPLNYFSLVKWPIDTMFSDKMSAKQGLCVHNLPIALHLLAKTNLV
jgi:hypothetical protein